MLSALQLLNTSLAAVPVVETARLRLRGYRADDLGPFVAMWQEPAYYRYLAPAPLPTEEIWKTMLRNAGHWAVLGFGFWVVEERATGRLVGFIGFGNLKRELLPPLGAAPEIGWVLAPAVHGRGYAAEGVTAALAWGEQHFGPGRTVCIIHPDNEPSLRLAARFGYREYARTTYKNEPIVLLERAAAP